MTPERFGKYAGRLVLVMGATYLLANILVGLAVR